MKNILIENSNIINTDNTIQFRGMFADINEKNKIQSGFNASGNDMNWNNFSNDQFAKPTNLSCFNNNPFGNYENEANFNMQSFNQSFNQISIGGNDFPVENNMPMTGGNNIFFNQQQQIF